METHGPGQRRAGWPVGQAPPTERQRLTPRQLQLPHRQHGKGTKLYLHTTDIVGLIIAELLETMSLYKMLHVHSNYRAISDLPVPH